MENTKNADSLNEPVHADTALSIENVNRIVNSAIFKKTIRISSKRKR